MKKIVSVLLIVAMVTATGCGGSSNSDSDKIESLEAQVVELANEKESLEEQIDEYEKVLNSVTETSTEEPEEDVIAQEIILNSPFVCEGLFEMTATEAVWVDEILPSNTSGVYSYYEDVEGEAFFVVKGAIKNISGDFIDVRFGTMSEIIFNDTYKYTPTWEAESVDGNNFSGYQIQPLQSTNFVIYASVPDELRDSFQSCDLTFGFADDMQNYVYEWEDCDFIYKIHLQ